MKLSEIRETLAREGIRLTKSLGQNFLHDANQLRRIVALAELKPEDRVLEIGPGLGHLTRRLLEQAGEVLAIEKDARLFRLLEQAFVPARPLPETEPGRAGHCRLLNGDALEFLAREPRDWSGWKCVSNLPYSVASPILVELAGGARSPERVVATVQIEVARRLLARAGDPDYGLLTLLVQIDFEPGNWFKIPATCFFPEPDVDSACVCLVRRPTPLLSAPERERYVRIVRRGFSQRRKMMSKLLRQDWPEPALESAYQRAGLTAQVRAEQVGLDEFAELARGLG